MSISFYIYISIIDMEIPNVDIDLKIYIDIYQAESLSIGVMFIIASNYRAPPCIGCGAFTCIHHGILINNNKHICLNLY